MNTIVHQAPAASGSANGPAALAARLKERLRTNAGRRFNRVLGQIYRNLFDDYRPERHYMRGPGPKWHAKND